MFNKKLSEDDIIFNYKKLQQKYKELFYENFDNKNYAEAEKYLQWVDIEKKHWSSRTSSNGSFLSMQVNAGNLEGAEWLLNIGADVDTITIDPRDPKNLYARETPLHIAIMNHNLEMVKLLFKHKSNHYLMQRNDTVVMLSVKHGTFEITQFLLESGLSPNPWQDNESILVDALFRRKFEMVKLLLKYGADKYFKHLGIENAMEYAKTMEENQNHEIENLLFKYGNEGMELLNGLE